MLKSLIYKSTPTADMATERYYELVELSRVNNLKHNITGFLTRSEKEFVQYIEGPPSNVDVLLGVLKADNRHKDLKIYDLDNDERLAPGWSMVAGSDHLTGSILFSHLISDLMDMYEREEISEQDFKAKLYDLIMEQVKFIKLN